MKILLTGGTGMLGKAILRLAPSIQPNFQIVAPTRSELNLLDRVSVQGYFLLHKFDAVIHCAAKVGGIKANIEDPIGFMNDNILINTHLIEETRLHNIPKLINLGSSCMYPRDYEGQLSEEVILTAPLEPTNEGYALAKIAAAKLCQYISEKYNFAYRTFIPCNMYGLNDNFDLHTSHMIAAAIVKTHSAHRNGDADIEIWGDGMARREFLFADDVAQFILNSITKLEAMPQNLNIGLGYDLSINEYYHAVANVIGFKGSFIYNLNAPVGMRNKLMNIDKAKIYGWLPITELQEGIEKSYASYLRIFSN
jgi:GDP-L-fucose synthase